MLELYKPPPPHLNLSRMGAKNKRDSVCPKNKKKIERVKKEGEIESNVNIIVYFNGNVLNTNEGVTFVCERLAYFSIQYMMFMELEDGLCQCINANTPKTVEKIRYRCPIFIFSGFIQYQAVPINDDNSME